MLIRELAADHVYLACGHTDMRKSIDGLAAVVQSRFQLDPHQSSLFLFCGRRKDRKGGAGDFPSVRPRLWHCPNGLEAVRVAYPYSICSCQGMRHP